MFKSNYVDDSWSYGHGLKDVMILGIDFIVTLYMPAPSLQEEEHPTLPYLSW